MTWHPYNSMPRGSGENECAKPILILGSGPYAFNMASMFISTTTWHGTISGFVRNIDPQEPEERFRNLPIYSVEEIELLAGTHEALCLLGECRARRRFVEQVGEMGFAFARLIHPESRFPDEVELGEGSLIGQGASIAPFCRIGEHCIFNSLSLIGESCVMGNYTYVAPGAQIAGSVSIGSEVFIGINATIVDHVSIGDGAIIGAGAVVIDDVPDGAVVVGNPARRIERRGGPFKTDSYAPGKETPEE